MSPKTDYYNIHSSRFVFILKTIQSLPISPSAKILDVGCYPPHIMLSLRHLGFDVYGISSIHETVRDKKVASLNIENGKLPYADNTFDLIVFTEILEHLISDPLVIFKEFRRILKPTGYLLITTPNIFRFQNIVNLIIGKNIYFDLDQLKQSDPKTGTIYYRHNREYAQSELLTLSTEAGLSPYKKGYFIAYPPTRQKNKQDPLKLKVVKYLNYFLMLIFNSRRDTIFLISTKRN